MSPALVLTSLVLLVIITSSEAQSQSSSSSSSSDTALQQVIGQILAQLNSTARHLRAGRARLQRLNNTYSSPVITHSDEGKLRLVGGKTLFEGNLEIRGPGGRWGGICPTTDNGWDLAEATVACRQMGFVLGALKATTGSRYGPAKSKFEITNEKRKRPLTFGFN